MAANIFHHNFSTARGITGLLLACLVLVSVGTRAQDPSIEDAMEQERQEVERIHQLLRGYEQDMDVAEPQGPSPEELARQQRAEQDAKELAAIPFSADKVRLSGAEGNTALAKMTQRLLNPGIPESRRDTAPICIIKTRRFDTLVGSESRSLRPVGKNQYITTASLQYGDTSLAIKSLTWEVNIPEQTETREYIITYYHPPAGNAEVHVFAVDDLLAEERPHIPTWLPKDIHQRLSEG